MQSTFFSSRFWFLSELTESVVVVVVLVLCGFLRRGSFLPNCQSEEVVEQLFDSVPSVPMVTSVSSVVFDVEVFFAEVVTVRPEVEPEVEPEVASEALILVEVDPVEDRRIERIGVDEALGLSFLLGGLCSLDGVVVLDTGRVEVSELDECTDGTFGFKTDFRFA